MDTNRYLLFLLINIYSCIYSINLIDESLPIEINMHTFFFILSFHVCTFCKYKYLLTINTLYAYMYYD